MPDRELDAAVELVGRNAAYELLRRWDVEEGRTGAVPLGRDLIGLALTGRTNGAGGRKEDLVELGFRQFRFDSRGFMIDIRECKRWTNRRFVDPLLRPENESTLTKRDAVGLDISNAEVAALFAAADLVVAHGAAVLRPLATRQFPVAGGRFWRCTIEQIGWRERGFEGSRPSDLLRQAGYFTSARGAVGDVDAMMYLLQVGVMKGRSTLAEAINGFI